MAGQSERLAAARPCVTSDILPVYVVCCLALDSVADDSPESRSSLSNIVSWVSLIRFTL